MYGIGTDIITISRIEKSLLINGFLSKVYGEKELELFAADKPRVNSLAANYAAKEAFGKALGTGVRSFELHEVQILRDDLGKPYFHFEGRAKEIVESKKLVCHVSLSHEKDRAIAFVVIQQK